jgi:hypothetical protein
LTHACPTAFDAQLLPQLPQLGFVVRSVSHPLAASWSQSPTAPDAHAIPHDTPSHVGVEFAPEGHGVQLVVPHVSVDELLAHVSP